MAKKTKVVKKYVDVNQYAASHGIDEIIALVQKGFVRDKETPIRRTGNHNYVFMIGTEEVDDSDSVETNKENKEGSVETTEKTVVEGKAVDSQEPKTATKKQTPKTNNKQVNKKEVSDEQSK